MVELSNQNPLVASQTHASVHLSRTPPLVGRYHPKNGDEQNRHGIELKVVIVQYFDWLLGCREQ